MATVGLRTFLLVTVLALSFWGSELRGVTIDGQCPDIFVGEVTSVVDIQTPYTLLSVSLSKVSVSFEIEKVLESENSILAGHSININILKHGPHQFIKGTTYEVGLNGNWLCSAKKID